MLVRDAFWSRRIEATPDFFNLTGGGSAAPAVGGAGASAFPLRLDIDINAPSSLRIENNIAKMVASADLKLQGTYDRPQLFGHVEIDRGDIVFEGNRYVRDARRRRLLQCVAHRAGLRHRGGDPRARAGADLQRHARVQRHDRAASPTRSTPIRRCRRSTSSRCCSARPTDLNNAELRALRPERRAAVGGSAAEAGVLARC